MSIDIVIRTNRTNTINIADFLAIFSVVGKIMFCTLYSFAEVIVLCDF